MFTKRWKRAGVVLSLLYVAGLQAQNAPMIGTVLLTRGQVEARDSTGNLRVLSRRAEIYEGETVLTGCEGFVQFRMVDEAQLAIRQESEFTFESYRSDEDPATPDSAVMTMVRGGFRTITGSIDGEGRNEYRIDTPFASISLNADPATDGAIHEAVLDDGALYTGVFKGAVRVSNAFMSLNLGVFGDYDFSRTLGGLAPEGLLERPPAMDTLNANTQSQACP